MKRTLGRLIILMILLLPAPVPAVEYTLSAGSFLAGYSGGKDDKGSQACLPVSIAARGTEWSAGLSASFRHSQAENASGPDESLTGLSDTTARITYEKPGILPFDVRFSLGMNIPTGKTGLSSEEAALFADTDLLPYSAYGEGLNINPSVAVANTWGKWKAGFGLGYTLRGKYDQSSGLESYDPGDIFIMTGEAGVTLSGDFESGIYFEYGFFGKDKQDGAAYYQQGDFFVTGANATFRKSKWDLLLNLEMILRTGWIHDDEILAAVPSPVSSTLDNIGDEIKIRMVCHRTLTDLSSVKGVFELARLNENSREESDPLYFGQRSTYRFGFSLAHSFSPVTQGEIGAEMFLMDADKSYFNEDETTYKGVTLGATLTRYF